MSFASKFNRTTSFDVDTTGFRYVKFSDLFANGGAKKVHRVNGMYIIKGKLETQPVFIDANRRQLVNAPAHLTEMIREILADPEAVQAIKDDTVGYTLREYESHGKKCYTLQWVDVEPQQDVYR